MAHLPLLLVLAACRPPTTGDTSSPPDTDTGPGETAETGDDTGGETGAETGDDTGVPSERRIFVAFGYPAVDEQVAVQLALAALGAETDDDGRHWTVTVAGTSWDVVIENTAENLSRGLSTPGAVVVYSGHSNYGLGPYFSDLPVDSIIEEVRSIEDFYNMATPQVAIYEGWLLETQAYPNLVIAEDDVVPSPTNYLIEGLGEERFPNDQGVAPGEAFTLYESGGWRVHYTEDGYNRLVVWGGASDLPDTLAYDTFFAKSCHSGRYYWEVFDQGNLYYTRDNVEVESESVIPTVDLFVKGTILGWEPDAILAAMNDREDIYAFAAR